MARKPTKKIENDTKIATIEVQSKWENVPYSSVEELYPVVVDNLPVDKVMMINHNQDGDPHFHCWIKFKSPVLANRILKTFGLESVNFLRHIGNWNSCITYAIHHPSNNSVEGKHLYGAGEVRANFDYSLALANIVESISSKVDYFNQIMSGDIKEYELTSKVDNDWLLKNWNKVQIALGIYYRKVSENDVSPIKVVYLEGKGGTGKTRWAKEWCVDHNLSYYVSSSGNNPFDDYQGQPVIIYDDNKESMTEGDFLKFTDPHNRSKLAARYHNIAINDCRIIFIACGKPVTSYYKKKFENSGEDKTQLYRRLSIVGRFTPKVITFLTYNRDVDDYEPYKTILNSWYETSSDNQLKDKTFVDYMLEDYGPVPVMPSSESKDYKDYHYKSEKDELDIKGQLEFENQYETYRLVDNDEIPF